MTGARAKHTQYERSIANQLGLSDAQLDALLRIRAGYWPGNAAAVLERKGFAQKHPDGRYGDPRNGVGRLTEAGAALLERARALGF